MGTEIPQSGKNSLMAAPWWQDRKLRRGKLRDNIYSNCWPHDQGDNLEPVEESALYKHC